MSDPVPPDEWEQRVGRPVHRPPPPRPDVVQVTEADLAAQGELPAEHDPSLPAGAPVHPTPDLAPPDPTPRAQDRPAGWRRPPGQQDDRGEPTGS
jgi:hypothetical protein